MNSLHYDLDRALAELRARLEHADAETHADLQDVYDLTWLQNDLALDGVVFGYDEIQKALDDSIIIRDVARLNERQAILNARDAILRVRAEAATKRCKFTLESCAEMQALFARNLPNRENGATRRENPIHRDYLHEFMDWVKVDGALKDLTVWAAKPNGGMMHPIEHAVTFLWDFMQIFPFNHFCGNTGRALANILIVRAGYLPVIYPARERSEFYDAVRRSPEKLTAFTLECMLDNVYRALKYLRQQAAAQYAVG